MAMMAGFVTCTWSPLAAALQPQISIAVPEFTGDRVSDELTPQIIISDLRASGRLALIEPNGLVEEAIDAIHNSITGAVPCRQPCDPGHIARKPDQRIIVEFRLWDVPTGQQRRAIWDPCGHWQHIPHAIAEAILRAVGRSGLETAGARFMPCPTATTSTAAP